MKSFDKLIIFGAGIISGLLGAGGGLLLVPFFTYKLKMNEVEARANTIIIILVWVIISGIIYYKNGFVDINLALKCAIGGILGSVIGSKLLFKISKKTLNILFIIFLFYSGIRMIII